MKTLSLLLALVTACPSYSAASRLDHDGKFPDLLPPRARAEAASKNAGSFVNLRNVPWPEMRAAAGTICRSEVTPPLAERLFGEIAGMLGTGVTFVAQNWEVIGPALEHASTAVAGLAPSAGYVAANLLAYAPHVLLALTAAGLLTVAVFQARLRAVQVQSMNQAREWQMTQAEAAMFSRQRRQGIRLPSFCNTNDFVVMGPSADRVAEGLIQNYIVTAFRARTDERMAPLAARQLELIYGVARQPAERDEF